ncbi:hypothetical protein JCM21714_2094 [Gracilibacillus boraciitolerans JCM 21714]|uniref:Uncharacterized protein n=1 Tax=Gracilibacillus boraciitolerans JCM 21714 TaxID=1298598 RepID=W4VJW4_9BACI|nr:hypothetical protein [Gracilibacillus boraciitolerans]GAE93059.1 hypothetical protein JCM21714_2094 [Gracilibacillus boraciitolerans JCM 21714]
MDTFVYDKHLTDKQILILKDLLEYRVLTTEMIRERFFNGTGRYVENVLLVLRKEGYIKSSILNKSRKDRKGYAVHQITERGKNMLLRYSEVEQSVNHKTIQHVKDYQVQQILLANEVLYHYYKIGWEIWDSRLAKQKYDIDYRAHLQGMVISPEQKRYGVYVLDREVNENIIGKIQKEIMEYDKENKIHDNIIIFKGANSYLHFIDYGMTETEYRHDDRKMKRRPVQTAGEMIVEPYTLHVKRLTKGLSKQEWIITLCNYYDLRIIEKDNQEKRQAFETTVEYFNQVYFLVDLTDSDFNKFHSIQAYHNSQSEKQWNNNQKVLVLVLSIETAIIKELEQWDNVELLKIKSGEYEDILI